MKTQLSKLGVAILVVCGLLGASGSAALAQTDYPIVVTVTAVTDADRAQAAADAAAAAAAAAEAAAAAAAAGDEVLGISQGAGGTTLAITGSTVSFPALAGASMIGLGGMALLAARKRRSSHR